MRIDAEVAEFQKRLREAGSYATPAEPTHSVADRLLGWADSWYYLRLIAITVAARAKVRAGRLDPGMFARASYRTLRLVEGCGGRVAIESALPSALPGRPFVFVANHMSVLETYLLPCLLLSFNELSVVVKEDLLRYPLFGAILRATQCIDVGRRNARSDLREIMDKGAEALTRGRSILVFPQSTRSTAVSAGDFNSIGAKLALRASVPVVPVALKTDFHGIGRVFRDAGPIRRDRCVHVRMGAPLAAEGNGKEAHRQTVAFIMTSLKEWGVAVREEPTP